MRLRDASLALAMALTPLGCGDADEPSCVPGAQVECACPGGDSGIQICASDGLSLGPCVCGDGAGGTGGDGAQGGEGPGGAGPGGAGPGGGGNGGSGPCAPGDEESCYDGPDGTENVGICSPGTRLCDITGAWGACMAQQLPLSEDCQTEADENCDGATPACGAGFVKTLGEGSAVYSLALDPDGNIFILGIFDGTIDFGGGNTFTDIGLYDTFIAKLDPNGGHVWSRAIGDPIEVVAPSFAEGLAVDSTGAVYAALGFQGDIVAFGERYESEGSTDGLLVKLTADGDPAMVLHYGSTASESIDSLVVDADDNVIFTMAHAAPIYFGGADVLNSGRALVKLDADGNHIFSRTTVTAFNPAHLALDPVTNAIVLYSLYDQTVDLGLGPVTASVDGRAFFGFFDPLDGSAISYGATGGQFTPNFTDLAVTPEGDIVVIGSGSANTIDFGQPNPPYAQAYVARLTPALQPVYVHAFNSYGAFQTGNTNMFALALDAAGDALVFAGANGAPPVNITVGATMLTDAAFSFELDAVGNISNVEDLGQPPNLVSYDLARAPDGVMVLGGLAYDGTFELGGQTLSVSTAGAGQGFLVRMAPN